MNNFGNLGGACSICDRGSQLTSRIHRQAQIHGQICRSAYEKFTIALSDHMVHGHFLQSQYIVRAGCHAHPRPGVTPYARYIKTMSRVRR